MQPYFVYYRISIWPLKSHWPRHISSTPRSPHSAARHPARSATRDLVMSRFVLSLVLALHLPSRGLAQAPLNARSFGAIPDDGKDDTVALRYLLGNCSKGGGEVFIPAGHYTVSPLTTKQGGPLPVKTVDILPVPSNCHVRGAGHSPLAMPNVTTIAMATTGGADGKGVNGVDGCWWRMFGWCGNTSRCHETPSNITITDLHLSGSTNYTEYAQIAGTREHGSLVFFYAPDQTSVIKGITVQRLFVEKVAGDGMDFGDGVQDLLVSDVLHRDCLRVGVDQAGYGPLSRNREIRHVYGFEPTPGVLQGNSIHIEEARNLTNVWIHDNVCNHSMDFGGVKDSRIENNIIYGQMLGNGNYNLTVVNNTIFQLDPHQAYSEYGSSPMLSQGFVQGANLSFNTFHSMASFADSEAGIPTTIPVGISVWGAVHDRFTPKDYYPTATNIVIEGNRFLGNFSGPKWLHRQDHVSPQGLVSVRTINLNGVRGAQVRGNQFGSGNVTDNLCECCTVVDQPSAQRCVDVVAEV
jgi:hypothetical protein